MEKEDARKSNLKMEDLRLIDFLSEDDVLVASPSDDEFEGFRLSVTFDNKNELGRFGRPKNGDYQQEMEKNVLCLIRKMEESVMSPASVELEDVSRKSICYRKSLAWDNAFFTGEGILDSEELCILKTKGLEKGRTSFQLRILEDRQKSANPFSTLVSDRLLLGSFEIDLNKEVRVSFSEPCSNFTSKPPRMSISLSSKKLDCDTSHNKAKNPSHSQIVSVQGSHRIKTAIPSLLQASQKAGEIGGLSSSMSIPGKTDLVLKAGKWVSLGSKYMQREKKPLLAATGLKASNPATSPSSIPANSPIKSSFNFLRKRTNPANASVSITGRHSKPNEIVSASCPSLDTIQGVDFKRPIGELGRNDRTSLKPKSHNFSTTNKSKTGSSYEAKGIGKTTKGGKPPPRSGGCSEKDRDFGVPSKSGTHGFKKIPTGGTAKASKGIIGHIIGARDKR